MVYHFTSSFFTSNKFSDRNPDSVSSSMSLIYVFLDTLERPIIELSPPKIPGQSIKWAEIECAHQLMISQSDELQID